MKPTARLLRINAAEGKESEACSLL